MEQCFGLAEANDCGAVKVILPPDMIDRLHAMPFYPKVNNSTVKTWTEEVTQYAERPNVYPREQSDHKVFTVDEFLNPGKAPPGFRTDSDFFLDAEDELWGEIARTQNKKTVYGNEQSYTLFPDSFDPLNIIDSSASSRTSAWCKAYCRESPTHTHILVSSRAKSTFAWHTEDEHLFSANFMHFGTGKVWYAAPLSRYDDMIAVFQQLYPQEYAYCRFAHHHKQFLVKPSVLLDLKGIHVKKTVQRKNQLIITVPKGFHQGFSLGTNCSEASNWGDCKIWLPKAKEVYAKDEFCRCTKNQAVVILNHQALEFLDVQKVITKTAKSLDAMEQEFAALRIGTQPTASSFRRNSPFASPFSARSSFDSDDEFSVRPSSRASETQSAANAEHEDSDTFGNNGFESALNDGEVVPRKRGRPKGSKNSFPHMAGGLRANTGRKRKADRWTRIV